jgi:hypothetical protein
MREEAAALGAAQEQRALGGLQQQALHVWGAQGRGSAPGIPKQDEQAGLAQQARTAGGPHQAQ